MEKLYRKALLKKMNKHIKEYYSKGLYSVCMSQYFVEEFSQMTSFKYANNLLKNSIKCDKKLPVSREVGKSIENLFDRDDIVVGIYKTTFDENTLRSSKVNKILSNGIFSTDQTFVMPSLTNTIAFPNNILEVMSILKEESKESKIEFILTFPKEIVKENGNFDVLNFYDIYNVQKDGIYIRSNFINSYIVSNQGVMNKIDIRSISKILTKNKKPTI